MSVLVPSDLYHVGMIVDDIVGPTPRRTISVTGSTILPLPPPGWKRAGIARRCARLAMTWRCSPTTQTPPAYASKSSTAHCSPTSPVPGNDEGMNHQQIRSNR